ncbi:hypothetical protein CD798_12180 [Bacillaceae bacterium SAOS 7]|nr:hypothetical protein CD798_12180 [Bacillaceae bacterium SAOS 7]
MWCVISDLDGTLLCNQQSILDETMESISKFIQAGGTFTLATGRSLQSALPMIKKLNIQIPVIVYNGARVYHPVTEQFIYERSLAQVTKQEIIERYKRLVVQIDMGMLAFDQDGAYYLHSHVSIEEQEEKDGIKAILISEEELLEKEIIKFMFLGRPDVIQELKPHFQTFNAVNSEPELLEILPSDVNKGEACKFLLDYLNIPFSQFVAVGDNNNDLEMIRLAEYGVAVNNANDYVKKASNYITKKTNEENAIGEILDWLERQAVKVPN